MNNKKSPGTSSTARSIGLVLALAFVSSKIYRQLTRISLRDKVVLITGGARGLGLALARELASKGASLILCSRTASQLEQARQELEAIGCPVFTMVTDLRDEQQVADLFQQSILRFGRIDMLINNAGVMIAGPQNVMDIDDFKNTMEANVWSSLYTIKAALPIFKSQRRGHIVNICSIGGKFAVPHMLPYSVSKFAMVGLSQGLAAELAKDRVKVTTVIPNLMRTGSPRNITVKGNHEAEYGWFKLAGSFPLVSQNADQAARQIVKGIENGRSEIVLTFTAKFVSAVQGIFPGAMGTVAKLMNALLPRSENTAAKKGWEAETRLTHGIIGAISDKAADKYNQY
jgi:short-subunit dehydrogenase